MLDNERIRRLREKLNLTQEEAAQRAGIASRQRWNDIESGRRANVSMDMLDRIAESLGCKAKDLIK